MTTPTQEALMALADKLTQAAVRNAVIDNEHTCADEIAARAALASAIAEALSVRITGQNYDAAIDAARSADQKTAGV